MALKEITKPNVTASWIVNHPILLLVVFAAITLALIPSAILSPDHGDASTEPGGEAFDLRDDLAKWLIVPVFPEAFLLEAKNGDVLTQEVLWELKQAQIALLEADISGDLAPDGIPPQPLLANSFSPSTNTPFKGIFTFADAVESTLKIHPLLGTDLENATNDQIKFAVNSLLIGSRSAEIADLLSVEASYERKKVLGQEIDVWKSPAMWFVVTADNNALGGGQVQSVGGLSADSATIAKEKFARKTQEILRGKSENYWLWGIAIDQNLEAEEEGTIAGFYIMLTVIAALGVISLAVRSYWATALTAIGIGILIIWLKGITALVGLKGGLIIDFIVPIAMISLGVDFAVHSIRRYREEKHNAKSPMSALALGFTGVLGALFLAMVSDGIAFLSNVPSGIEAVVHFGISAGVAVASAFVVLGLVVPLALAMIETQCPPPINTKKSSSAIAYIAGAGVTFLCGLSVILMVALSLHWGISVLILAAILFVVLPFSYQMKKSPRTSFSDNAQLKEIPSKTSNLVTSIVTLSAHRPIVTLALAFLVTTTCLFMAIRLESSLDVKDFFDEKADFVVSLDKADEHIGPRTGEGGTIYLKGDMSNPEALRAINLFMQSLTENPYIGTEADGEPSIYPRNVIDIVKRITKNSSSSELVNRPRIKDDDLDGLPDSQSQLATMLKDAMRDGVPMADGYDGMAYTPEEVHSVLYFDESGLNEDRATVIVGIPGTREQTVVIAAEKSLMHDLAMLENVPGITKFGLTGSPFTRTAELAASTDALRTSLPIAAIAALFALTIAMRSFSFAFITVIPIGLVVTWLYAFMFIAGFSLNFVTATIGALSIGVGIDYSIHMTERFREEFKRHKRPDLALEKSAKGTGTALLGSAGSSIVGFTIMGFAPMPVFSTYGILTAIMIFFALAASLLVLPSLLVIVSRRQTKSL
ncbi:MAG: hypothetical protein CMQ28_04840 [Gammaproteobacteria bacterium]|mgnify:CR=1 FL=1|nr:hypothetical protein [Gammaproteobacteria bacterium]|tara:strand:- start:1294 stop:4086 length:2793 start_codon:yes stop_codon:yes gene_type:complete